MSKFKKYNPYKLSNRDYHLTKFTSFEDKESYSFSGNIILTDFLEDYGIYLKMTTQVCNLEKEPISINVHACILDRKIPVENIGIIDQMYGYSNSLIQVILDVNDDRWYSFWFNTEDKSCELQRVVLSEVKWSKKYKNFRKMMKDVRGRKSIDELC